MKKLVAIIIIAIITIAIMMTIPASAATVEAPADMVDITIASSKRPNALYNALDVVCSWLRVNKLPVTLGLLLVLNVVLYAYINSKFADKLAELENDVQNEFSGKLAELESDLRNEFSGKLTDVSSSSDTHRRWIDTMSKWIVKHIDIDHGGLI